MKTDQEQWNATYERVRQVFTQDLLKSLAPQQIKMLENAVDRVANKEGPEALTIPRLEGIKEMVLEDLFPTDFAQALQVLKS